MLTVINRKAFGSAIINLPNKKFRYLTSCVWHGPKGLSSKRVLHSVYGYKLERLFRKILNVPNATSSEAREYLEQLRNNATTTMGEVAEVYVFLQKYRADT
jgi:hypothetical protein